MSEENERNENGENNRKRKKGFLSMFDDPGKAQILFFASHFFRNGPGAGPGTGTGF